MSTPVVCEVGLWCTDPRAEKIRCEFYEAPPWTALQDRTCVHRSVVPAGDCTHPQARRAALRKAVLDALGFMSDEDREAEKRRRIEER